MKPQYYVLKSEKEERFSLKLYLSHSRTHEKSEEALVL